MILHDVPCTELRPDDEVSTPAGARIVLATWRNEDGSLTVHYRDDGQARIGGGTDDPADWTMDRVIRPTSRDDCEGHPAGPFDPMGETVFCDGSCRA